MNFIKYLKESKKQLDISILAAGKYLTTVKKIEEFLTSPVQIEHKTDGVKLTVIKKDNNGNLEDYIFSYKGNVLYSTEYDYQPNIRIKNEAIGASQFKTVFNHFIKLGKNNIPVGTELFIEFLMHKPTLSSNYSKKHKMVLIGHSKSTWEMKFGKLKTTPNGFFTDKRDEYAKELKIDTPQFLFDGILGSEIEFKRGIKNKILMELFRSRTTSMSWNNPELLVDDIRTLFLDIESKYGGKEEGVVIKYNGKLLKWQQEYQLDKEARFAIKQKYREDLAQDETIYWESVKLAALTISNGIVVKSRKLEDLLAELSLDLNKFKPDFSHSKKTLAMIKDDIQLNAKMLIIKKMRGNNNALIIGKFRVLTKEGHTKLIKRAQTLYDDVVVCVVTSKENKETKLLREQMIRETFPNVKIIHAINGNLTRIIQKSPVNVNVVYAGSDRVQGYTQQLKNMIGMNVKEMKRSDSDISASKVINNLHDKNFFLKNTPNQIHHLYDELLDAYT